MFPFVSLGYSPLSQCTSLESSRAKNLRKEKFVFGYRMSGHNQHSFLYYLWLMVSC